MEKHQKMKVRTHADWQNKLFYVTEKAVTLWPSSASYDSVAVTKNEKNEEQGKKEKFQHISSSNKETATEHDACPRRVHSLHLSFAGSPGVESIPEGRHF